ncbi:MAG: glycosyltransferase [Phreatobacter sp.]|uniref:glycosyltransferase n=1 Tax=Phreatobacter sp. TaxID=1966341 RepID=UPI001A461FFE|nr:glycosyltransferase [Phreatobacter sp.]MBL8571959.1 glycosyltransferase [Phreatobacter sp.]
MTKPLVVCVINEAWFFRSHFLPWAKAAVAADFEVIVAAASGDADREITAAGIGFVPSPAERRGLVPRGLWAAARQVARLVNPSRPTIIHAFGLHGMAIAALARRLARPAGTVVSVTGLGFLAISTGIGCGVAKVVAKGLARSLDGSATIWLTENAEDSVALGLDGAARAGRLVQLVGVGVDLAAFKPQPFPPLQPLRLIMVARMIRSKGADLAVAALVEARAQGIDATLSIAGDPDTANPRSYGTTELAAFAETPGVYILGARNDVPALLAGAHVFLLPSRGGEGLPKALLEAAAAGRPAIVTDVPGCRDFVTAGKTGWVVPAGDAGALASAIAEAACADLAAMGTAARAEVEASAVDGEIAARVVSVYRRAVRA